jgi:hypothetical protein
MVAWFCAARSAPGFGARLDMADQISKEDNRMLDRRGLQKGGCLVFMLCSGERNAAAWSKVSCVASSDISQLQVDRTPRKPPPVSDINS